MLETIDYFLYAMPGLILSAWAQARISWAYQSASRIPSISGLTGAETAEAVMRGGGVSGVTIEPVAGELSDHYDPRGKVLRLSPAVYGGRSLAALGIAAHEAGHAIQDASRYPGLVVRNFFVPVANLGSQMFWLLITAGFALGMSRLVLAGLLLFSAVVLFQLLNLPVEFDASRRGRAMLVSTGAIRPEEEGAVANVLNAAAWTYVAAALSGVLSLIYLMRHRRQS